MTTASEHRPTGEASTFVGRRAELEAVGSALSRSQAQVFIEGEAGIGKTRFVHECLAAPGVASARLMKMSCPPLAAPFPLGPVLEALHRQPLDQVPRSSLHGALRPLLPEWAHVLPDCPEPLPDPAAVRHRVLRAIVDLVQKLQIEILVVEDAHWADASTLELLLTLTSAPRGAPRVVVSYRDAEVGAGSLLRRLAGRAPAQGACARVSLRPFDVEEVRQLLAATFRGADVSCTFARFLHRHTGGVPLALQETLSLLRDRGDLRWHDGAWSRQAVEELRVPPTVRDSVLERAARLSPEARATLEAAAVLGGPVDEPLLRTMTGLAQPNARLGLVRALDSGLLREERPGFFAVRHELARIALEDTLSAPDRQRMHARAAAALQRSPAPPVGRLRRHARLAGDLSTWSRYTESAADLAMEAGDDHEAVRLLLEQLSRLNHPPTAEARLARKLATAACWGVSNLGSLSGRVTTTLRSILDRQIGSPDDRAEIRLMLGRLLLQLGECDTAAKEVAAAVEHLGGRPTLAARALMSLAWPRGHTWRADEHLQWLQRATRLIPEVSDPTERRWLQVDQASVLLMLGRAEGWPVAATARSGASTLAERRQVARLLMNLGHMGIAWGRDREAEQHLREAVQLMEATGYERLLNSARLTAARLDWHTGEWDGLADRINELAEAPETLPEARLEGHSITAMLEAATGSRARASSELRQVLDEATRRSVTDAQLLPAAALSRLHLARGQLEQAVAVTEAAVTAAALKNMWLWAGELVIARVEALVLTGVTEDADDLLQAYGDAVASTDMAPLPRACHPVAAGIVAQARGDLDQAVALFAAAAEAFSALPRPYDQLLAMERQAGAELRSGQQRRALDRLVFAQAQHRERRARTDASRLARLLRHHGVEVTGASRGGRRGYGDELSPREREVAGLVARGLTNRQVAQELFLSPRTVERHLGSAMRKLRVPSRTALTAAILGR